MFTWGSPILGGFVSQTNESFRNQLMILSIIQAFAVLFMVLFVPETSFDRSSIAESNDASVFGPTTITTVSATSSPPLKSYFKYLQPLKSTAPFSREATLKSIRALSAPSVLFSFLLTGPLVASAYGIANSLSLLFAAMPTFLFPEAIGYLFISPLIFALVAYITSSISTYLRYRPPHHLSRASTSSHLTAIVPGLLFGVVGLLGFGLYVQEQLSPEVVDDSTVFSLNATGRDLSLRVVSLLFGILVAGCTLISFAASAHLESSSIPIHSGNFNYGEDLFQPAHAVLQNLLIGIFVVGFPTWIVGTEGAWQGLKDTVIAISVLQIVVASTLGALLFAKGESLRVVDERVLGIRNAPDGTRFQKWESERITWKLDA
jgi:hypothetical protein